MTVKTAHSPNSLTNNSTSATEVNDIQVEHQTTANNVLGIHYSSFRIGFFVCSFTRWKCQNNPCDFHNNFICMPIGLYYAWYQSSLPKIAIAKPIVWLEVLKKVSGDFLFLLS